MIWWMRLDGSDDVEKNVGLKACYILFRYLLALRYGPVLMFL